MINIHVLTLFNLALNQILIDGIRVAAKILQPIDDEVVHLSNYFQLIYISQYSTNQLIDPTNTTPIDTIFATAHLSQLHKFCYYLTLVYSP